MEFPVERTTWKEITLTMDSGNRYGGTHGPEA